MAKLDKVAKATEDSLNLQIKGWEIEINSLKTKVEEYRSRAESAQKEVEKLKNKFVKEQNQKLTSTFTQGINQFSEGAKQRIQHEIEQFAAFRSGQPAKGDIQERAELLRQIDIPSDDMSLAMTVPNAIPIFGGFSFSFRVQRPLVEALRRVSPVPFDSPTSAQSKITDPYKIRVDSEKEAQEIGCTINDFCTPHIQNWWIDTQDQLVREGTLIRTQLVEEIQADIQKISDELSNYIGEALNVDININPIQFPRFEFPGIDAQIQFQQEVYKKKERKEAKKEGVSRGFCEKEEHYQSRITYEKDVEVEHQRSFYEVDLRQTAQAIKQKIDRQADGSRYLLQRVIERQISDDFKNAEKQINDYIKRFQEELDRLLRDRETKEAEADQIRAKLEAQKVALNEYLSELTSIQESLNTWKPIHPVKSH